MGIDDRTFAAGIAYEIEAPLSRAVAGVCAVIEALERGEPGDHAEALRSALESAGPIAEAVRGLAAFRRGDEDGHVSVHEAIELAIHLAQPMIGKRASLKRRYGPLPPVRGSRAAIARMMVCLLRNAAEAIPSSLPHANTITVQTGTDANGAAVVEVVDTGVGIEPGDVPYVFDPFFTTKPRAESVGLGLALVRATVAAMGGSVRVESTVGRGSRFTITLPGEAIEAEAVPLSLFAAETPPTRRVLCVADSAGDARRIGELLDEDDAYVLYMTCDEAIEELATGEPYDLVMCDAGAAAKGDLRARLRRVAPGALGRVFDVSLRGPTSGVFARADAALVARAVASER
jgi:anti-sigma regulatory factor (Ser/Thr protein kinase)